MIHADILVYNDPDGRHYVGLVGEAWWRWPAERNGWHARHGCTASLVDACWELEPALAVLALRLSGAEP